jgi:peptidoglycan-associated lipoprotein
MKKALHLFLLAVTFALLATGCHHNPQIAKANPPTPPKQSVAPSATLTVSPKTVQRGQTAELTWNTQGASDVTLEGIGTLVASGHRQVTAAESTTYHLIAKGDGGSAEANARLTVTIPEQKAAGLTDEELFARNVKDIFFNYDNADIRADEQSIVSADARLMAAHPDWRLGYRRPL